MNSRAECRANSLVILTLVLSAVLPGSVAVCFALTDANTQTPESAGGVVLEQSVTSSIGHFEVFYNDQLEDGVEGIRSRYTGPLVPGDTGYEAAIAADALDQAREVAEFFECAWWLYTHSDATGPFAYPFYVALGSPHLENSQTVNVPVWIKGTSDSNGGTSKPRVEISPWGGVLGCPVDPATGTDRCGSDPEDYATWTGYDSTVFHEYGHTLFKSYNVFLNSGPVRFLNEGLPSGYTEIPLNHSYTPEVPVKFQDTSMQAYLDLRNLSIREYEYGATPLWYFLASNYTSLASRDDFYGPVASMPQGCRIYYNKINGALAPQFEMRRLLGRDVIWQIQNEFRDCHPLGLATPDCSGLDVQCATFSPQGQIIDEGCVPAGFPGWTNRWSPTGESPAQGSDRVGEVLMPKVFELVDKALIKRGDITDDPAIDYQAFSYFLEQNYLNNYIRCWDVDKDFDCTLATEDKNGDGSCSMDDCFISPQNCWDLNLNGICDHTSEDTDGSGSCNLHDCPNAVVPYDLSYCWDLNHNRSCDSATEDADANRVCDTADCPIPYDLGNCWDLNFNGSCDPLTEDVTGNGHCDVFDCPTWYCPQNCWDLNRNSLCDVASESLNGDSVCDITDCPLYPMIRPQSAPPDPAYPYRIKSFGAHYHELRLNDREIIVRIDRDASTLPNAAYAVFFSNNEYLNPYIDWTPLPESEDIVIYPMYPLWERAVVMVAGFEGVWDYSDLSGSAPLYSDTYGHYQLTSELVVRDPDAFDDGLITTPDASQVPEPPEGWRTERNDYFGVPAHILLGEDTQGRTSVERISALNFDTMRDEDFYLIRFPEDAVVACTETCLPDAVHHTRTLRVSLPHSPLGSGVQPADPPAMEVSLYVRDGSTLHAVDPAAEGWLTQSAYFTQLEIACPGAVTVDIPGVGNVPLLSSQRELLMSLRPTSPAVGATARGRVAYDMNVYYEYDRCVSPRFDLTRMKALLDWREPEPAPVLFPTEVSQFYSCKNNPACDPDAEFLGVYWGGGDLKLLMSYRSPSQSSDFGAVLYDADMNELAAAERWFPEHPSDTFAALSLLPPQTAGLEGKKLVSVSGLPAGQYYLMVDGPFPTEVTYQFGGQDDDGDQVDNLFDNCISVPNLYQFDGDNDEVGDLCDNCPDRYNPEQTDSDLDGVGNACDPVTTGIPNQPPIAMCLDAAVSADETCRADASINNGSYDPDGVAITVEQIPPGPYELGDTAVELVVTDSRGDTDHCTATVSVHDSTPPVITSLQAIPNVLWPPNHKMTAVQLAVAQMDNCSSPDCEITYVASNEPDDGKGDGRTTDDIEITGPLSVNLRAERSGKGQNRTYTVFVSCTDADGNVATASTDVVVPRDRQK